MQVSYHPDGVPISQPLTNFKRRRSLNRGITIALFLLPGSLLYLAFVILPVVQAGYYSLFRWNGLGPIQNFIGLDNYFKAFGDKIFVDAFTHNLIIAVLSLAIQLPIALGLALIVGRSLPGRTFFRLLFFLPYVISEVVAGVIWSFIYHPDYGLLNNILKFFNPNFQPMSWLGDTNLVLFSIFAVMCWKYFGLHLVLYVAGLQQIPAEIEEAARMDGANARQVIQHITIPLLGSTIRLSVFLSVLGSLQYFDLIWVMSNGGPVHFSETMATYLLKFGFQRFSIGYGSSVGMIMVIACFTFSLLYQRFVMQRDFAGSEATSN